MDTFDVASEIGPDPLDDARREDADEIDDGPIDVGPGATDGEREAEPTDAEIDGDFDGSG